MLVTRSRSRSDTSASAPATSVVGLPFAHLNLRRNPFGEPTRDERGEMAVVDVDEHIDVLRSNSSFAVQFVGNCGRGKTTHMLALHRAFPGSPYVYVPEDGPVPRMPTPAEDGPLFIDEMQRVPRRTRREVMRRGRPLVIGTHRDHTRELRRHGYAVETIRPAAEMDAARLREIVHRRIEWARRGDGDVPRVSESTISSLLSRYGDDVRAIEGHLYDVFQQLERIDNV